MGSPTASTICQRLQQTKRNTALLFGHEQRVVNLSKSKQAMKDLFNTLCDYVSRRNSKVNATFSSMPVFGGGGGRTPVFFYREFDLTVTYFRNNLRNPRLFVYVRIPLFKPPRTGLCSRPQVECFTSVAKETETESSPYIRRNNGS